NLRGETRAEVQLQGSRPGEQPCRALAGGGREAMTRRTLFGAATLVAATAALFVGQKALDAHVRRAPVTAPAFEVDPFWPKPLPNPWVLGNVIGVGVDARDHVFVVHRVDTADTLDTCCQPAPPVIEFDPQGNVVSAWGGPHDGYVWPGSNH